MCLYVDSGRTIRIMLISALYNYTENLSLGAIFRKACHALSGTSSTVTLSLRLTPTQRPSSTITEAQLEYDFARGMVCASSATFKVFLFAISSYVIGVLFFSFDTTPNTTTDHAVKVVVHSLVGATIFSQSSLISTSGLQDLFPQPSSGHNSGR